MAPVFGFDEVSARRIIAGIVDYERTRKRNKNTSTAGRSFVRVTGAGTPNPAPPAYFASRAAQLVASDDADATGYVTLSSESLFVLFPAAETPPAVGKVIEADFGWTDDDGVGVYVGQLQGSGGTCIDVDTSDSFTVTIPGQVTSWTGSIGPPPECALTLTPDTYAEDTVLTYTISLTGNTCTELILAVTGP